MNKLYTNIQVLAFIEFFLSNKGQILTCSKSDFTCYLMHSIAQVILVMDFPVSISTNVK